MSDIRDESRPKVYWSVEGLFYRKNGWANCKAFPLWSGVGAPSDAVELVPQASRDELREALARAIYDVWQNPPETPCFYPEPMADAVLDVLADRFGLVASPETGEGE